MKRQKIEKSLHSFRNTPDFSTWITATSTKAYMLKDPILDWLKYRKQELISRKRIDDTLSTNFIMKKGIEFEEKIVALLKQMYDGDFIDINGTHLNVRDYEKFKETKIAIRRGVPIIFSGVLWNYDNKTYGIPDLLIRSDYINDFIKSSPIKFPNKKASNLLGNYHYIVIDIKYKTLRLCADGENILNEGLMPCYKAQLYVYNEALGKIQGYTPENSYLLGRRWCYKTKNKEYKGEYCFDKLGIIKYDCIDTIKKSFEWVKFIKNNANNIEESDSRIFPNMCNKYDQPYTQEKLEIASRNNEITNIWMCGVKNREYALSKGINKWSNDNCNSKNLNINGKKIAPLIDSILNTNRGNELISPSKLPYLTIQLLSQKGVFVDFETINDAFIDDYSSLPRSKPINMIFQIGIGWTDEIQFSSDFNYKSFVVNSYNINEEKKICIEFVNFLKNLKKEICFKGENLKIYHWSSAEVNMWKKVCQNYKRDLPNFNFEFIDVMEIFKREPITIKGVYNFGLKNVAKKLYEYKFIKTIWNTETSDGCSVMINAIKALEESKKLNIELEYTPMMQDIIKYNEVDCKTLFEIVQFLKKM